MEKNTRTWAMLLHLSVLLNFVIPFGGVVAPILIWQLKKEEMPEIDAHGKMVVNFLISLFIYSVVGLLLMLVFVGIFVLLALAIVGVVFPIIGGIKANDGQLWKYPMTLELIK